MKQEIHRLIELAGSKMKSGVGSSRSNASSVTASTLTEHDYIGLSEVSSSSHTSEYTNTNANATNNGSHIHEKQIQESNGSLEDAELNLGLSLSYKREPLNAAAGFTGSEKAFQKWVSQEEYQRPRHPNGFQQGVWARGGFEHRTSQEKGASCSSMWQGGQLLRSWEGARILTAEDLQAPPLLPPHTPVVQDVADHVRSGYAFPNSGRVIMPPPTAGPVAISGTKRIHNDADVSDGLGLQESSEISKGQAVVGWPPIGTYRSKTRATTQSRSPLYVKVNMDGVPIGRKVDLNAHDSYETLALALEDMFQRLSNANGQSGSQTPMEKGLFGVNDPKQSRLLDNSSDFVLTYEDKEGDWMLVGDVPWRMFVNTVKRLRILKTSDANGLAPRRPEKMDGQKSKAV